MQNSRCLVLAQAAFIRGTGVYLRYGGVNLNSVFERLGNTFVFPANDKNLSAVCRFYVKVISFAFVMNM